MTAIEWTDTTWNPTTGCDQVSPGCGMARWDADEPHGTCYALTMAKRLKGMGQAKYQRDGDPRTSGPGFGITEHPDVLGEPLRWRKPRRVFVNSMSDLFHDGVSDEFIAHVWAVMAMTPHHTYQVLTKRHGRMRSLLNSEDFRRLVGKRGRSIAFRRISGAKMEAKPIMTLTADSSARGHWSPDPWPLPNVWMGVSVEDQKRADMRVPALLDTPAAVRFLSCEPLLGPVDLWGPWHPLKGRSRPTYWTTGRPGFAEHGTPIGDSGRTAHELTVGPKLDWVIAGGESGPGARPAHPSWFRKLRDQCEHDGVAFFFKQWGEYGLLPRGWHEGAAVSINDGGVTIANDGTVYMPGDLAYPDGPRRGEAIRADHGRAELHAMYRVGKHEAGRELDGRTWDEYPAAAS